MAKRANVEPTELTDDQRLVVRRHIAHLRDEATAHRAVTEQFEVEYNYCRLSDPDRGQQLKPFVVGNKRIAKLNDELADALEILLLGGKPINPASEIPHYWRYGGG